jgi:hypothetical protein
MAAQQAKLFFVILSLSAFACCDTGIIYFLFYPILLWVLAHRKNWDLVVVVLPSIYIPFDAMFFFFTTGAQINRAYANKLVCNNVSLSLVVVRVREHIYERWCVVMIFRSNRSFCSFCTKNNLY